MSYGQLYIANLALDALPTNPIASLSEKSIQARAVARQWAISLNEILERADWGFARVRVTLTALVNNDRPDEWAFAYQIPPDVAMPVRLLRGLESSNDATDPTFVPIVGTFTPVYPDFLNSGGLPYDYAGSTLYANEPNAVFEYVSNATGFEGFTAMFVTALAANLAAKIAPALTKDRTVANQLMQTAEARISKAIAANNNRRPQTYGDFVPAAVAAQLGYDLELDAWIQLDGIR